MSFSYFLAGDQNHFPSGSPKPPYGPTIIEVMRSCLLRCKYSFTKQFVGRMGMDARIGTVMHRTIQASQDLITQENLETAAGEIHRIFYDELNTQKVEALRNPREATFEWNESKTAKAYEASLGEFMRIREQGKSASLRNHHSADYTEGRFAGDQNKNRDWLISNLPVTEINVYSIDKVFTGYIDRIEKTEDGIRIIDYKSATRNDLPDRYARQIQFYAQLLFEQTGIYPDEGVIFYPLIGSFYSVPITPELCQNSISDAKRLIAKLETTNSFSLASPGDTCKICAYRPWCKSFWSWQGSEKSMINAKERAATGFEGKIAEIKLTDHYWRVNIKWRQANIRLVAPQERFPHLSSAQVGSTLRVLDAPLIGALTQPSVSVYDSTEIFIVN